jgi:hypothetical protein
MTVFLGLTFYVVMVLAALAVEGIFALLHWVPTARSASVAMAHISLDYTSLLDVIFAIVAVLLSVMFLRTDGPKMMRMMARGGHGEHHHHDSCNDGGHTDAG